MRKLFKCVILLLFLWLVNDALLSQTISIPFECGFEDSVEISQWELNVGADGAKCQDQWMIGNLEYNEGLNSLYISCDTGRTSSYGSKPNVVIAYRKIKIPDVTASNKCGIDISFDWKCNGASNRTALNFYLMRADRMPRNLNSLYRTGALPTTLAAPNVSLFAATEWQTWVSEENTFTVLEDTEYYLMFVWQNSNQNPDKEYPLGACVDNLQISIANCRRPEIQKTTFSRDTIVVEWTGSALSYEVHYRQSGKRWFSMPVIPSDPNQQNKVVLEGLAEGVYDIRVRGICGDAKEDCSIWAITRGISYIPENHCINYVDLNREDVACQVGEWPLGGGEYIQANSPLPLRDTNIGRFGRGPVNAGESSIASRHQVNWTQGVFDPRTGNKLRTIPEGSLASVRLGNWDIGGETEAIVFKHYVDTADAKIILMKYAIVLEAPGHGLVDDPYFKLEIMNEFDEVIDAKCAAFDFSPENKTINWQAYQGYVWKDWTSIGINVVPYHGQVIKIRLITRDCLQYGHAGYAYFTLDCVDAAIKSTGCADKAEIEMIAPEGFAYEWTMRSNPDSVISTERILPVPSNDTATYDCRVEYIDVAGCGFDLFTSIVPRFPYSNFDWKWVPSDCENKIMLLNKGGVNTKVAGQFVESDEKIEESFWFIDGENWYSTEMDSVMYVASKNGDTLSVSLQVSLAEGACSEDTTIQIIVPPIHDHLDTLVEKRCPGDYRLFNNEFLGVSGVYTEVLKNMWGCDSVTILDLTFLPDIEDTYVYDTICHGEKLKLWGDTYSETGTYNKLLYSKAGCDSVVILNLEVIQPLGISLDNSKRIICADESALNIDFDFIDSLRNPTEYSIVFDSLAIQCGFVNQNSLEIDAISEVLSVSLPENCRPNSYTATLIFNDSISYCGDYSVPIDFDVYYSSSIMDVKFDNLISIFDVDHNGGYEFISYQWYKNNELIEGETNSYLYLDENIAFENGDCYYLILKRLDDGVVTRTCEYCFGDRTSIDDINVSDIAVSATLLDKGQAILIENIDKGSVNIYSFTGQLVDTYVITSNLEEVYAPKVSGFYLLEIKTEDKNYTHKIWVR